jgi:Fe-S-cluster-containing dehydrogenase component/anaerobic selenocysteine-containing dehydrogenase
MNHNGVTNGAKSCKDHKGLVQIGAPPEYWKSPNELKNGVRLTGEFPGGLPGPNPATGKQSNGFETSRRDFLSLMGFSLAVVGAAGCRAPVQQAIPLLVSNDQIVPGVSNYYATTCGGCASSCSLLVKQRDGRPIKIEGNDQSSLFGGATCATGQATVLSLYDDARLRGPQWQGKPATWDEIDQHIMDALHGSETDKRKIVLLSGTITSPSTLEIIDAWSKRFPSFRHVVYDAVSYSALRAAQQESFGRAVIPHYNFDKAKVIVGIDADFLGTWLSPVEFSRQYGATRKTGPDRSLHIQFEPGFSVTGSNADVRVAVAPSDLGAVAVALLRRISQKAGSLGVPDGPEPLADPKKLDAVADELWKHRGESIIVSGVQDVSVQIVVNALNSLLGNIGKTVDIARPSLQRAGDDKALSGLVEEMNGGAIHALIMYGVNPGYDYPAADQFLKAMEKVPLTVSFADRRDETSSHATAICPDHHFLEAWGDAEPVDSYFSLSQPLIAPLFDTRAAQESLLKWTGKEPNFYAYVRDHWQRNMFPRQKDVQSFDAFWDSSLQSGVVTFAPKSAPASASFHGDWKTAAKNILDENKQAVAARHDDRYEVHFYESVPMRDGRHANNPWLQELPEPISKVTWGNFAAIGPKLKEKLGLSQGDVVSIKTDSGQVELPVFEQPGQESRTISVSLGYGRKEVGKCGKDVGVNVFPLTSIVQGSRRYWAVATLEKTGKREDLGTTQEHFSMEGRPLVQEVSMDELGHLEGEHEQLADLWGERPGGEHSWGMAIDLNACTGCSACVVACQAENNVPVVGKDQIERIRIMHWIRIDRYYNGPVEDPVAVHQPMMCQHCANAPCETVCPVLATTTSSEGINQQVYNRCIGTRYCANNCPYKVRRFNWYNYTGDESYNLNRDQTYAPMNNSLGRLVLNPDVVVRSRGVMEKCSLCVQRIQLAKNIALQGKRELADGDIKTACQQACPTEAIVFGDLKDPNSKASQLRRAQRHYQVLEDLGTRPNVGYLKKVRNTKEA